MNFQLMAISIGAAPTRIWQRAFPSAHARADSTLGAFPPIALMAALGLLGIATANTLSRQAAETALPLFWLGIALIVLPIAARLLTPAAQRRERILLVMLLGLSLYAVKVFHSPYAFTFSDELVHGYNAQDIALAGVLFKANPILKIVPYYPGLEITAATVSMLGGISIFHAGLMTIGAARLLAMLALFMFYERAGQSSYIAGLACLFYIGNSNFLYFSAQFSYESLAFPLLLLVLSVIACRHDARRTDARAWNVVLALLIISVSVTHHMTSYILSATMIALTILNAILHRLADSKFITIRPLRLSAFIQFAVAIQLIWIALVTSPVIEYLGFTLGHAIESFVSLLAGLEGQRALFTSSSGQIAPLWQRFLSVGAILLTALGVPFGLWRIWHMHRWNIFALFLAGASVCYFGALALRFTSAGWETSNRASALLFIGIAFSLAQTVEWSRKMPALRARLHVRVQDAVIVACAGILFAGGVFAGWTLNLLLSQPYRIATSNRHTVEPESVTLAGWMLHAFGAGNRVAASATSALMLLAHGQQESLSSWQYDIYDITTSPTLGPNQLDLLRRARAGYLVFDRRKIGFDNMRGLYFNRDEQAFLSVYTERFDTSLTHKFDDNPDVDRIYDSGDIMLYDVRRLADAQIR